MHSGTNETASVALLPLPGTLDAERVRQPGFSPRRSLTLNIGFRLDGEPRLLSTSIRRPRRMWKLVRRRTAPSQASAWSPATPAVRRLHPSIRGDGAPRPGASLVSFNLDAFTSYGKEQGDNAPTSEVAAFRYGAALNVCSSAAAANRLPTVGDTTVVFWADASAAVDETLPRRRRMSLRRSWIPRRQDRHRQRCAGGRQAARRARKVARGAARQGRRSRAGAGHALPRAGPGSQCRTVFGALSGWRTLRRVRRPPRRALRATSRSSPPPWGAKPPSVQRLLVKTTALQEKFDNIPPLLAGEVMRAVLTGVPYPRTLLTAAIIRLRAGDDPWTGWHAAAIKACIRSLRKTERRASGRSNRTNPSEAAYQLGRLFAVLEAAQYAALGRVNAPIARSLLRLGFGDAGAGIRAAVTRGHASRIRRAEAGRGGWIDGEGGRDHHEATPELPRTLRLEDQGRFAIGYYHERAFRRPSADEIDTGAEEEASQ